MLRSSLVRLAAIFVSCLALVPTLASSADISPEIVQKFAPGMTPEQAAELLRKSGLTPDQALALLHKGSADLSPASGSTTPASVQAAPVLAPRLAIEATVGSSALERNFSMRAGVMLTQFGYDLIGNGGTPANAGANVQAGAVQDSYILGPGDTLSVTLRGQENSSYDVSVSRDGTVTLPLIAPISAAGRPFGDFRKDLERAVAAAYIQTRVYVTVNQIRQVTIQVVGEVARPGVYSLSGLSTALDALSLAGGIKKSGSLRNVQLVRGDRSYRIDLYALLMTRTSSTDMGIAQGDRIIVPAVGATVAVTGDVRRAGIYELPAGAREVSSSALLALANGTSIRGVFRSVVLQIRPDGRQELVDVTRRPGAAVRDGEVLYVQKAVDETVGQVTLAGAVKLPGVYSLATTRSLHDLLPAVDVLSDEAYVLFGFVDRIDHKTLQRTIIPFSPLHVIEGRENLELKSRDVVHILTVSDVRAEVGGTAVTTRGGRAATGAAGAAPVATPETGGDVAPGDQDGLIRSPSSVADDALVTHFIKESVVDLTGAVRDPGTFPVMPGTSLAELIIAANGLSIDVDLSQVEITSRKFDNASGTSETTRAVYPATPDKLAEIEIHPFDQVVFHHVYSDLEGGTVTLSGEFRYPGAYKIKRGERLSSVIARAGGLTEVAYPLGAVFTRTSVADEEQIAYANEAKELEDAAMQAALSGQMAANIPPGNSGISALSQMSGVGSGVLGYVTAIAQRVRTNVPLGRMSVVADPAILATKPSVDIILQPGDALVMPRRPASVNVTGEVRNPIAILFDPSFTTRDYIERAGGVTDLADEDDIFIVMPDGTTRTAESSDWLSFSSAAIPPGASIVVPRDIKPTNWLDVGTRLLTVISQLAITAASIAVINHN